MDKLTSVQVLDKFLMILYKAKDANYKTSFLGFTPFNEVDAPTWIELKMILNKLEKDGYVTRLPIIKNEYADTLPDMLVQEYELTFEGKYFIENGGYVRKLRREKIKEFPARFWYLMLFLPVLSSVITTLITQRFSLKEKTSQSPQSVKAIQQSKDTLVQYRKR